VVGLYYSAVSISENSNLRKSIREYAIKETQLLDSIGTAHMEMEIQKRVIDLTKEHQDRMTEESGIETAISDDEMKRYLQQVLDEIKIVRKIIITSINNIFQPKAFRMFSLFVYSCVSTKLY
jgi:hypothetical protein